MLVIRCTRNLLSRVGSSSALHTPKRPTMDFGDGWQHRVVLEAVVEDGSPAARVLEATRACPPEDVGGIGGYEMFIEALANPKHRDHREMREWAGGAFDAEAYDIDAANRALARLRLKPRLAR